MNLDAMTVGEVVQHVLVTLVAVAALAVVLRKVLGVFDRRQSTGAPVSGGPAPACSHCPTGQRERPGRGSSPSPGKR